MRRATRLLPRIGLIVAALGLAMALITMLGLSMVLASSAPTNAQEAGITLQAGPCDASPYGIRVYSGTVTSTAGVANAMVFRLEDGDLSGAQPLGPITRPLTTDDLGCLQGRVEISAGDRLVALLPITHTDAYTLYLTSAQPSASRNELVMQPVGEPGMVDLVVSPEYPLYLFNLDLSLEWDARNDGTFLNDLAEAIKRSSELLYDVSNGQMALGKVRVFQNRENWLAADAVVYASNSIRPRATMGGVVDQPTSDVIGPSKVLTDAFVPGQIRMGPLWDPYGQSWAELTQEWWQALAHEYGHYLLFMPDNYLGYAEDGSVAPVDCPGSFMTTAYDDGYSEFLAASDEAWRDKRCQETIAAHLTGRSDWETIKRFYPEVNATDGNDGPPLLPLDVTQVVVRSPQGEPNTLPERFVDLRKATDKARLSLDQGQAYLFQRQRTPTNLEDDTIISLGTLSKSDRIKVRGAKPGDRLCVVDTVGQPASLGCVPLNSRVRSVPVSAVEGWQPNIEVRPVVRPAAVISVSQATTAGQPNIALFSLDGLTPTISLAGPLVPGQTNTMTVSSPRLTISFTQPVTPGVPYVLVTMRPTLLVTTTFAQPGYTGTLSVQVFPAYPSPNPDVPMISPSAPLSPGNASGQVTFTQAIPLEYPTFAGFVRVWDEDLYVKARDARSTEPAGEREAVTQFFLNDQWEVQVPAAWVQPVRAAGTPGQSGQRADWRGASADWRGASVDWRGASVDWRGASADWRGASADWRGASADWRGASADWRGASADWRGASADWRGASADWRGASADWRGASADWRGASADWRGASADLRAWGANRRAPGAPIASEDGQVSVFNRENIFEDPGIIALQTLPAAPGLPDALTPVGNAYRFVTSQEISRTMAFNYLQREVPDGYENTLKLYYSGDEGRTWQPLLSHRYVDENLVTAPGDRSGLYVLAAGVDIPLPEATWHLIAYPIAGSRPVTEALQSIAPYYATVVGYDGKDRADPWKVFDTEAPPWASDLKNLEFGQGYWISVTQPVILQLDVSPGVAVSDTAVSQAAAWNTLGKRTPPAVYYGTVTATSGISTGMPISASIDGMLCGSTLIQEEMRYVIKVLAADTPDAIGCGAPGRQVAFSTTGGRALSPPVPWDNTRPRSHDLQVAQGPVSPVPLSLSCRELVVNGDFEADRGWTRRGLTSQVRIDTDEAVSGARALHLGPVADGGEGARQSAALAGASQRLRVPQDATTATLTLRYKPQTTAQGDDFQRIRVLPTGQAEAVELWRGLADEEDWQEATFDLGDWKGQSLVILLEVYNRGGPAHGSTAMFVDDVSLQVCR